MLFAPDDLANYLQVESVNVASATLYAGLVEGLITDEIGAVASPPPAGVLAVAYEATARAYRNPDGLTAERVDDYGWNRSGVQPGVYLTADEIRRLHVAIGGMPSRSVALQPTFRIATTTS